MVNRVIGTSGPQLYTQQEAQDLLSAPTTAVIIQAPSTIQLV